MNAEPEHTGEELIRLRAENRSLAADLYLAKKEVQDLREIMAKIIPHCYREASWEWWFCANCDGTGRESRDAVVHIKDCDVNAAQELLKSKP